MLHNTGFLYLAAACWGWLLSLPEQRGTSLNFLLAFRGHDSASGGGPSKSPRSGSAGKLPGQQLLPQSWLSVPLERGQCELEVHVEARPLRVQCSHREEKWHLSRPDIKGLSPTLLHCLKGLLMKSPRVGVSLGRVCSFVTDLITKPSSQFQTLPSCYPIYLGLSSSKSFRFKHFF